MFKGAKMIKSWNEKIKDEKRIVIKLVSVNLIWEINLATAIKCNKTEGIYWNSDPTMLLQNWSSYFGGKSNKSFHFWKKEPNLKIKFGLFFILFVSS